MAVVYPTALKNARMELVLDAIDAGSGPGKLEIGTAGMASVLAVIELASPAGTVSGGVLTLDMPQSDTSADNAGTAAEARFRDSDDNDVATGLTVGDPESDANVKLASTNIIAGVPVTIQSATLTHG